MCLDGGPYRPQRPRHVLYQFEWRAVRLRALLCHRFAWQRSHTQPVDAARERHLPRIVTDDCRWLGSEALAMRACGPILVWGLARTAASAVTLVTCWHVGFFYYVLSNRNGRKRRNGGHVLARLRVCSSYRLYAGRKRRNAGHVLPAPRVRKFSTPLGEAIPAAAVTRCTTLTPQPSSRAIFRIPAP